MHSLLAGPLVLLCCAGGLLVGCVTNDRVEGPPGAPGGAVAALPALSWSTVSRRMDDTSLLHSLVLHVDGVGYAIASDIPSLDEPSEHREITSPGALAAYAFGWHVSGDTFLVRHEPGRLAVYRESWGDENEGESETVFVKAIPLG